MTFLSRRVSPAMIVAVVALFVALTGTSYAAIALQIGSAQIVDNSILSRDIHDGTLQSIDVRDGSLTAQDFVPGVLPAGFSTYKDSFQLNTQANALVPVTHLDVPAGSYVVIAKLFSGVPQSGLNESVRCELVAGGDVDRVADDHDAITAYSSLALTVVHQFATAGTVTLNCGHQFTGGNTPLGFIKITAIRVATLSNTAGA